MEGEGERETKHVREWKEKRKQQINFSDIVREKVMIRKKRGDK